MKKQQFRSYFVCRRKEICFEKIRNSQLLIVEKLRSLEVRVELDKQPALWLVEILHKASKFHHQPGYVSNKFFEELKLSVKLKENKIGWYLSIMATRNRIPGGKDYYAYHGSLILMGGSR